MRSTTIVLVTLVSLVFAVSAFAQVEEDYGSATFSYIPAADNYCTCNGQTPATHTTTGLEWLGGAVDVEADCYDDNDSDGIIKVYHADWGLPPNNELPVPSNPETCGELYMSDCLVGHSLGVVEADICVIDRNDARYQSSDIYFSGWWDANHDGDFLDAFDWSTCPEVRADIAAGERLHWLRATQLDINTNEPVGACEIIDNDCFVPDLSAWTANCARYRLTFATPCNMPLGNGYDDFWMRFRLGYDTCVDSPCGTEAAGEVEDIWGGNEELFDPICNEQTAIELASFEAEVDDNNVQLIWETFTETDNAGFNLWRSEAANGTYVQLNGTLIPAQGDPFTGATYSYVDANLTAGKTYYYLLEDVNIYGQTFQYGPIDATIHRPTFGCGVVEGNAPLGAGFILWLVVMGATIAAAKKRSYRKPEVKTASGNEMINKIGPAQTCSPTPDTCTTAQ